MKKILIQLWGGIGDMIWLTPSLIALRKKFPKSEITVISQETTPLDVIKDSGIVNECFSLSSPLFNGVLGKLKLLKEIMSMKSDIAISNWASPCFTSSFISFLSGAKVRIGQNRGGRGFLNTMTVPSYNNIHEVEANLKIFSSIGVPTNSKNLFMHISEQDKAFASEWLHLQKIGTRDLLIGIHPGPKGKYGRQWNIDKFVKLCKLLNKKENLKIIVFGGPDEGDLVQYLCSCINGIFGYVGRDNLNHTAAIISRCSLFISNDSGLAHIASAVGVPVIAIFGPTVFWQNRPYGEKNVVIRKDLPCSPCYKIGKPIKCKTLECLKQITVDEVFEKADKMLSIIQNDDINDSILIKKT
ncbi:glycosyltransferase family 9 protein [candidate division WOR-3 bacterium]|nr:glycosyltransferase family 9 protein [candidate division WOR-3 bacterium]